MTKVVAYLVKSDVAESAINTARPLTHPSEQAEGGLAVDATHTQEEWRALSGYERAYEVSSLGRIRSLERIEFLNGPVPKRVRRGRILKPHLRGGYLSCRVFKGGVGRHLPIHIAVCAAFSAPKTASKQEVRHLNGDPLDNRALNLRWGSHSENMLDRVRHGTDVQVARTHCPRGHEYSGENLHVYVGRSRSRRQCRACDRIRQEKRRRELGITPRGVLAESGHEGAR